MSSLNKILILLFFIFSSFSFSQSSEDLAYLDLLPDNQAQSIAERLGVQTGKPVNDEIRVDSLDPPSFSSLKSKSELEVENYSSPEVISDKRIFGLNLFKESPSTFAPIDLAPAPRDYVLGPGDEIRVQFFGSETINRLIPVNREGNLIVSEIGDIQVSGLTFEEAKQKIESIVNATLIGTDVEISLAKISGFMVIMKTAILTCKIWV